MLPRSLVFATLLSAAACSPAHAERSVVGPSTTSAPIALSMAPSRLRAPYDVEIIREDGESLPTYAHRGRYYVQGDVNERYVIRITNPTPRRVEAVVTVDGLDVIDGENGDLRKRGYVVPAYGETRIEGFRTSLADVATFRFSSVSGSYAGQKGKARNVGVIAVALFEERARPEEQVIVGQAPPPPRPYDYRRDVDRHAPATAEAKRDRSGADDEALARASKAAPSAAPRGGASADYGEAEGAARPEPQRERLGLGTEFGEQRYSSVSYTQFVRAPGRPVAIAELRYNDTAGLMALGIPVAPMPDEDEVMTRETANPFPGDHFARAPR